MSRVSSYPNILIISHNVLRSNTSNGKTILSIFRNWPKENLLQLYFSSEFPEIVGDIGYLRIRDTDVFSSFFKSPNRYGSVFETNINFGSDVRRLRVNKPIIFNILRDFIWGFKKINLTLFEWINKRKPDFIFFVASNNRFSYDYALDLSTKYNAKIIVYFTDDYILGSTWNPINLFHRNLIRNRFKSICSRSFLRLSIGKTLCKEYSYISQCDFITVMNMPVLYKDSLNCRPCIKDKFILMYSGNLSLKRWENLLDIAKIIKELRLGEIEMNIYSIEKLNYLQLNKFKKYEFVHFKGAVNDDFKLSQFIKASDVVIHVESFRKSMIDITKFSISTKISEYLAYGKCILSYGPSEVASMNFLHSEKLSIHCNTSKDLKIKLSMIYKHREMLKVHESRAKDYYIKNMANFRLEEIIKTKNTNE
jgi:glycosyltransferase involved in cell wall biosynthesis